MSDNLVDKDRALLGEEVEVKGLDFVIKEDMIATVIGNTHGSSSISILDTKGQWRKTRPLSQNEAIKEEVYAGEKCCVLHARVKFVKNI